MVSPVVLDLWCSHMPRRLFTNDTAVRKKELGPEVIKRFFMLNSAEHKICPANKSQITYNCKFFLAEHS